MKNKILIFTILAAILVPAFTASAQRTSKGTVEITGTVNTSFNSFGAELTAATYLTFSYVGGGISYVDRYFHEKNYDQNVSLGRAEAMGFWMARFWGSRGRTVNFYAGGDLFVGIEMLDPFKRCTDVTRKALINTGFQKYKVIYGLSPRVEAEFFVSKNLALVVPLRLPITFNTNYSEKKLWLVGFEAGVGVRYNF